MVDQEDRSMTEGGMNAESIGKLVAVLYQNGVIDSEDMKVVFSHMENGEEMVGDFLDKQEEGEYSG